MVTISNLSTGPFGIPEGTQTPDTVLRRHVLYSTELLGHILYGCFAISKHYHRTRVDFEVLRLTLYPHAHFVLKLTELVLHTSLELVAYGFEVRHSIQLS